MSESRRVKGEGCRRAAGSLASTTTDSPLLLPSPVEKMCSGDVRTRNALRTDDRRTRLCCHVALGRGMGFTLIGFSRRRVWDVAGSRTKARAGAQSDRPAAWARYPIRSGKLTGKTLHAIVARQLFCPTTLIAPVMACSLHPVSRRRFESLCDSFNNSNILVTRR
jgi:hypothetical protein